MAEQTPAAAIVEAYGRVEGFSRIILSDQGQEPDARWGPLSLARMAVQQGRISPETAKAIEGIGRRNQPYWLRQDLRPFGKHSASEAPYGFVFELEMRSDGRWGWTWRAPPSQ